jgi:hypothetical protein
VHCGQGQDGPSARRAQEVGIKQACSARPTTFRRSAHERLGTNWGLLARQGGWAVLNFCWRGCFCCNAVDARVRLHACLQHIQSPRHPGLLSHSRSLTPSLLSQRTRYETIAKTHPPPCKHAHPATADRRLIVVAVDRPATTIYR